MAKIEPWEQKIRDFMEGFATQVNNLFDFGVFLQSREHENDPEQVPDVDPYNDPKWISKLVTPAKEHVTVWGSIVGSIYQHEEGNSEAFQTAIKPVSDFYSGSKVRLEVVWEDGQVRLSRQYLGENPQLFTAFAPADQFFDYVTRYSDIVHLGVCRLCQQLYVKPKHGQKMRYCSASCRQKAYRQRKKESDG